MANTGVAVSIILYGTNFEALEASEKNCARELKIGVLLIGSTSNGKTPGELVFQKLYEM